MPRTVEEGFRDFLLTLTPSTIESQKAKNHRASIEDCLKDQFKMDRFVRIGSFGNGTSISGHSDVDYLASIPSGKIPLDSNRLLEKVRGVLQDRFPNTSVCMRCPAVVISFGTTASERTEIVPADCVEDEDTYNIYEIADGKGGWTKACPDAHNAYVRMIDNGHENRVKPLIRFIKAWKYFQHVPISSFYLELRVAKYAHSQSAIIYKYDILNIFRELSDKSLAHMQDPKGVSGYIEACSTQAKRDEALSKISTSLKRVEKAIDAEHRDEVQTSFGYWQLIFNGEFPTYYK